MTRMLPPFETDDAVRQTIKERLGDLICPFFGCRITREQLVLASVGSNTFRAYQTTKYRPSSLFRTWAIDSLGMQSDCYRALVGLKDSDDVRRLHALLVCSLQLFWRNNEHAELPYYKIRKLVDLFIKFVTLWDCDERHKHTPDPFGVLKRYTNVPLDSFTLNAIRTIATQRNIYIPNGASMGYVNHQNYDAIQR
ncbi:MAG: hypothetical protein WAL02_16770, partial [Rhodoplanes sp.]